MEITKIDTYLARVGLVNKESLDIESVHDAKFSKQIISLSSDVLSKIDIDYNATKSKRFGYEDYLDIFEVADDVAKYVTYKNVCKAKGSKLRDKPSKPIVRRRTRLW